MKKKSGIVGHTRTRYSAFKMVGTPRGGVGGRKGRGAETHWVNEFLTFFIVTAYTPGSVLDMAEAWRIIRIDNPLQPRRPVFQLYAIREWFGMKICKGVGPNFFKILKIGISICLSQDLVVEYFLLSFPIFRIGVYS